MCQSFVLEYLFFVITKQFQVYSLRNISEVLYILDVAIVTKLKGGEEGDKDCPAAESACLDAIVSVN